ncbi:hypothetical protein M8C21_009544, partial [Ambrosia artemisiifolia]
KYHEQHERKVIHSIKVGTALVLVSLLYLLDPLFKHVGESSMWAIMTVVLIYDFFAGATLSKGILRGIGTILGGVVAQYCRMIPSIKRKCDYGIMIYILTFNLVAVSGLRADRIWELARLRLIAIAMGVAIVIITNLLIYPMWAGDELHNLTSSKFNKLACCIEECMEASFGVGEKKGHLSININGCKSVLNSKSNDESLANFAKWEPWHGNFGFSYPWEKYLKIGELLRELAAIILPLHACIALQLQASTTLQQPIKDTCKNAGLSLGLTMRELGESILKMKRGQEKVLNIPALQSFKLELTVLSTSGLQAIENVEGLAIANILFLLMEIVDKVKVLAKEVEELGEIAGFESK